MFAKTKLFVIMLLCVFVFSGTTLADTQWPKSVRAISSNANETMHICLTAFAKNITKYTPIENWVVQPLGGPMLWLKMMHENKADFAMHSAPDMYDAFMGQGAYAEMGPQNVRNLGGGHELILNFVTTPNTGIKSIEDLKGKSAFCYSKGNPLFSNMTQKQLALAGLTVKDLKATLTHASLSDSVNDLIEGRVDALLFPFPQMSAIINIKEARGSYHYVTMTKEQGEELCRQLPGYYLQDLPINDPRHANTEPVENGIFYQIGLWTWFDRDSEVIYGITKAIFEHGDEIADAHPALAYWNVKSQPGPVGFSVPYHDGAIKYYMEKGLWTDEHQAYQDKLLAEQAERIAAFNAKGKSK